MNDSVLTLEAEHIVCLSGGNNVQHLVIFKPTMETVKAVRAAIAARRDEEWFTVQLKDDTGIHDSKRHQRPVTFRVGGHLDPPSSIVLTMLEV